MPRSHDDASGPRRWRWTIGLVAGGIAILAGTYVWLETVRTGRPYDGSPEEIVDALLQDIRVDIEAQDWTSLGSYGVGSFLSWKNPEKLREYVEAQLGDESLGLVDYVVEGVPEDVLRTASEIRFTLVEPNSATTCQVLLQKHLGWWRVRDIGQIGVPRM